MTKEIDVSYYHYHRIFETFNTDKSNYSDLRLVKEFETKLDDALAKGFPIDYAPLQSRSLLHRLLSFYLPKKKQETVEICINLLLDKGADVNSLSDTRGTALITLSKCNPSRFSEDLWKRIIAETKDINQKDEYQVLSAGSTGRRVWEARFESHSALEYLGLKYISWRLNYSAVLEDSDVYHNMLSHINLLIEAGANTEEAIKAYLENDATNPNETKVVVNELICHIEQQIQLADTVKTMAWDYELQI